MGSIDAFKLDQNKNSLRYARFLTIWMSEIYTRLLRSNDHDKYLTLLAKAVKEMDALTTFSFALARTRYTSYHGCQPVTLSRVGLSNTLDALPRTVINLELDTGALDRSWWTTMSPSLCCQLCASIRRLLPKLHHLRLRMQFVCPAFLFPFDSGRRQVRGNVGGEESTTNHFPLHTVAIWLSPG